ncbi:MAG: glycosyltransferase family A protein [Pseudomonadota bacterium]
MAKLIHNHDRPRISFGIIVLNGEPFTRYCLRSLYPFAHQIIVVEGGSKHAAPWCTPDGHSTDGTLNVLYQFKKEEDPDNKVEIVTKNGFWAEKDEQSQAYAERVTGDWLWQVDIDEFYLPTAIQRTIDLLQKEPDIAVISFPVVTFWGDLSCVVQILTEPFGDRFLRLFRFGPGYVYAQHRPPTVFDDKGRNLRSLKWYDHHKMAQFGIYLYHYSALFPHQVLQKSGYYQSLARGSSAAKTIDRKVPRQQRNAAKWAERCFFRLERPFRVHPIPWHPSWLESFIGHHPPEVVRMMEDIRSGRKKIELRPTKDIEQLLANKRYLSASNMLRSAAPAYSFVVQSFRHRPWRLRRDLYWRLTGKTQK